MANAARGTMALAIGAVDYTLAFTTNALCELEEAAGMPAPQFLASLEDPKNPPGIKPIRLLLWAGLLDHHNLTLKEAGGLIDEVGLDVLAEKLGAAVSQSMPEPEPAVGREAGRAKKAKAKRTK